MTPNQPSQAVEAAEREKLIDLIRQHLTATYHCTRVWDAWNVGTMTQDDFEDARESDLPFELADAILDALARPHAVLEALKLAIRQNEHDMLMTGEELRMCRAATIASKATAAVEGK